MVLGFLLYEAIDLVYHSGKITYNGASSVYNWYYGIDNSSLNKKITQMHLKYIKGKKKHFHISYKLVFTLLS